MKKNSSIAAISFLLLLTIVNTVAGETTRLVWIGSDAMSYFMRETAEAYAKTLPGFQLEQHDVSHLNGRGYDIRKLFEDADLSAASRHMEARERKLISERYGEEPLEVWVGSFPLYIIVHKDNPIQSISMDQLGRIFAESPDSEQLDKNGKPLPKFGGKITLWSQLGVKEPAELASGRIAFFGCPAASSTYSHFQACVLRGRDHDKLLTECRGFSVVQNEVGRNRFAVGYCGPNYWTSEVQKLPVSPRGSDKPVAPTDEAFASGDYPLLFPCYIYVRRKPSEAVKNYLRFVLSEEGQKVIASPRVKDVPLTLAQRQHELEKLK